MYLLFSLPNSQMHQPGQWLWPSKLQAGAVGTPLGSPLEVPSQAMKSQKSQRGVGLMIHTLDLTSRDHNKDLFVTET